MLESISQKPDKTPINVNGYGVRGTHSDIPIQIWDRLYYFDDDKIHFEAPINMNGKNITDVNKIEMDDLNVNKIVTTNLDVNGQIDMKCKKIVNLPYGQSNGEAINKEQYDALDSKFYAEIIALQNAEIIALQNSKIINWYYYTDNLKHNHTTRIKFQNNIDKHPFKSLNYYNTKLRISVSGSYHVIYTDNIKNATTFTIHDDTNNTTKFTTYVVNTRNFSQLTINAVINIQTHNGFGYSGIYFELSNNASGLPKLEGSTHSTFYIKYLHP